MAGDGVAIDPTPGPLPAPCDRGIRPMKNVRPAALIASALRPFAAEVTLVLHGRSANARSTVAMMSLGAHCGDSIVARASGADARAALDALGSLLAPVEAQVAPRAAAPEQR